MFKDKFNNYKAKVAFDFDKSLSEPLFQYLAQHLINRGHDVWVLTARIDNYEDFIRIHDLNPEHIFPNFDPNIYNQDIFDVCKEVGIPKDKIIFTNYEPKLNKYKEHNFDLLFDDDAPWHCNGINENGGLAIHI